jgi:hypothetical protein
MIPRFSARVFQTDADSGTSGSSAALSRGRAHVYLFKKCFIVLGFCIYLDYMSLRSTSTTEVGNKYDSCGK